MYLVLFATWTTLAAFDPLVGVIFAGLAAPVGAYLLAARKMSGKIGTTEASDLWAESRAIREWSAARIDKCDEEIYRLKTALDSANARITELEREKRRLENLLRKTGAHNDL